MKSGVDKSVATKQPLDKSVVVREQIKKAGFLVEEDRILTVPVDEVTRLETQPRIFFDAEKIKDLGESIKENGQAQPVLVVRLKEPIEGAKYQLIDGERRLRAIKLFGLPTIRVVVCRVDNANQQHLLSLISNFNREDHTHAEKMRGVFDLKANGMRSEAIATAIGKSVGWVASYFAISRLDDSILAKLDPPTPEDERIGFSVAVRLSSFKAEEQLRLLKIIDEERQKGTSQVVINEMVRRIIAKGHLSKAQLTGTGRAPRTRKPSDDLKAFHAFVPRIQAISMRLEDLPSQIVYRFYRKYGNKASLDMVEIFRKCAELLIRHKKVAEKVIEDCGKSL